MSLIDWSLFDKSEWQSWLSGQPLANFLATLNAEYPNHVYLNSHSQGGVACAEALHLATSQVVNTYVATQAASSARAYDNTLPPDAATYYTLRTPDSQGHYWADGSPSYFTGSAGAGRWVNFYNPRDWALMGNSLLFPANPGWLWIQSSKPDHSGGYYYAAPTANVPFGYYQQNAGIDQKHDRNWPMNPLYFPADTYRIFAECAQSYSLAVGAEAGVGGTFTKGLQIDLSAAPYNFTDIHLYHDGPFVSDNMNMAPYWNQLLVSYGLKTKN